MRHRFNFSLLLVLSVLMLRAEVVDIPVRLPSFATDYSPIVWRDGFGFIQDRLGWSVGETPADRPHFVIFPEKGQSIPVRVEIPDALHLRVYDAIPLNQAGLFVASASAWNPDKTLATMLIFIDPLGKPQRVVRTNPILVKKLTVSPDGHLWGMGVGDITKGEGSRAPEMIYRFDKDGLLLEKFLPAGSVQSWPSHPAAYSSAGGQPFLGASANVVGAYFAVTQEWMEFQPDGKMIGSWHAEPPLDSAGNGIPRASGMALTTSGRLFASLLYGGKTGIFEFDKEASRWRPAQSELPGGKFPGGLVGSHGDDLICLSAGRSGFLYRRVAPAPAAFPKQIAGKSGDKAVSRLSL